MLRRTVGWVRVPPGIGVERAVPAQASPAPPTTVATRPSPPSCSARRRLMGRITGPGRCAPPRTPSRSGYSSVVSSPRAYRSSRTCLIRARPPGSIVEAAGVVPPRWAVGDGDDRPYREPDQHQHAQDHQTAEHPHPSAAVVVALAHHHNAFVLLRVSNCRSVRRGLHFDRAPGTEAGVRVERPAAGGSRTGPAATSGSSPRPEPWKPSRNWGFAAGDRAGPGRRVGHARPRPHWPGGPRPARAVSRRCDRRCKSSSGCEPLQDMVVAVPLQQWAGRNQMPGQRPVVPGLQECATEFLARSWPGQVRPERAEQDKVGRGERLRGQPDERIRSSKWTSSPSLAQQTHGLPLKPSPRPPLDCPRSGVRATSVWHRRMPQPIPAGPASWTHSSSAQRYGQPPSAQVLVVHHDHAGRCWETRSSSSFGASHMEGYSPFHC